MSEAVVSKYRVQSIDILRGLVMIIMALDHVRDFFHIGAFQADPVDPATSTPMLYATRWITHLCAPTFVFLAGTSSYIVGLRKSKGELSSFLIKRGLWLILVEVLIISLALSFNPLYNVLFLQVIWAIGSSMVILGLLVRLPLKLIFLIGLLIVLGHNLLDYPEAARAARQQPLGFWWDLLHGARFAIYPYAPNHVAAIIYPFLPWTGIMLIGYSTGKLFEAGMAVERRRKILTYAGLGLITLFFLLRLINAYGDPVPWIAQANTTRTIMSFFNVNKYPPSLMYTAITLGIALLALALLEKVRSRVTEFAKVFGSVPFFFYVLHFYLIHALTVIAFYASGYGAKDIVSQQVPFLFRPLTFGFSLWVVYLVWFTVILLLYPVCKRYSAYKRTHGQWWLSYI